MCIGTLLRYWRSITPNPFITYDFDFPNLHSLGLNVDWTSDEKVPYDLLANIVRKHRIQHLEINLPHLCRYDSKSWPYPNVDENTCQALVQSLDKISVNLLSLHVIIGDWFPFKL
ncbi:hypothetical protein N7520_001195 [Penicillium odoratum]|uniref:uncharacterized protein n=1 Tax=Penicillium odoratum TaxID=1167516 RepID=UPI002549B7F7|nr:uncharacterized protein N7520_001195 [Penicillium odoratum]KAJ5777949.1 hypothetical protein N7520_001195 [Penicillium odoratum]